MTGHDIYITDDIFTCSEPWMIIGDVATDSVVIIRSPLH